MSLFKTYLDKYRSQPVQAKAAVWYLVCNFLQKGISLITVPLYTRLLTTEQYGAYQVFLSWVEIFEIVTTLRLSWGGYSVGLTKFNTDRDGYSSSMQCMSITVTTGFLLLYLILAKPINHVTGMTTELTLLIFLLMYAIPALGFWSVRQRVECRYQAVVAVTLTESFLIPALGLGALFFTDWGEMGVIGARVLVQLAVAVALIWVNCRKKFVFFQREYWSRAICFNLPLLPHYLSIVVLNSSDRIMIERMVGQGEAGIYGVAYGASSVMGMLNAALTSSLQPWFFQRLRDRAYKGVSKMINGSLLLVSAANLLLIAMAPEAVAILAPPAYQDAIVVMPPLASSVVVMYFYQHFLNIEFFYEDSTMITLASFSAAVLNVWLNFKLIPIFGYWAAGYTTLFSYLLFGAAHYAFMCRILKREAVPADIVDIKGMLLILIAFFLLAGVLALGYNLALPRYAILLSVAGILIVNRESIMKMFQNY